MAHHLLSDPFVAAEIEAVVAPYVGKLPDDEVAWMRDQLAELLESDPEARAALAGAHPRKAVDHSGERTKPLVEDEDERGAGGM